MLAHLELMARDALQICIESHIEIVVLVTCKDALEALLKDDIRERVCLHKAPPSALHAHFHLVDTTLVQGARKDVDGVTARDTSSY